MLEWLHQQHARDPYFPLGFSILCLMALMARVGCISAIAFKTKP